jgi:hypothetical protein
LEWWGVHFRSLQEQLDTTTSGGRLVFRVRGALADAEGAARFELDYGRPSSVLGLFHHPSILLDPRKVISYLAGAQALVASIV